MEKLTLRKVMADFEREFLDEIAQQDQWRWDLVVSLFQKIQW